MSRTPPDFDAFDSNRDGVIDRYEWAHATGSPAPRNSRRASGPSSGSDHEGEGQLLNKLRSFSDRSRQILNKLARTEEKLRDDEMELRNESSHIEQDMRSTMNFVAGAHPVRSVSPVPVIISPRMPPPRVPIPWEAMGVVMPPEELHAHSAEMCDLVDKLGRASQLNERLQAELRNWEREGKRMSHEVSGLRNMLGKERQEGDELRDELQHNNDEFEVLHEKHTTLLQRAVLLEEQRDKARSECQSTTDRLKEVEKRARELNSRMEGVENERTLAEATLREKDAEVRNLWAKNSKLTQESSKLSKNKQKGEQDVEDLKHRLEVLRKKNEMLEKRLESDSEGREHTAEQLIDMEQQMLQLAMALGEKEQRMEQGTADRAMDVQKQEQLQSTLQLAAENTTSLNSELRATTLHRDQLLESVQKGQFMLDSANIRNTELIRKLQVQGQQRMHEVEETKHLVAGLTQELEALGSASTPAPRPARPSKGRRYQSPPAVRSSGGAQRAESAARRTRTPQPAINASCAAVQPPISEDLFDQIDMEHDITREEFAEYAQQTRSVSVPKQRSLSATRERSVEDHVPRASPAPKPQAAPPSKPSKIHQLEANLKLKDEKLREVNAHNSKLLSNLQAGLNSSNKPLATTGTKQGNNQAHTVEGGSRASASRGGMRPAELATNAARRWAASTDVKLRRRGA